MAHPSEEMAAMSTRELLGMTCFQALLFTLLGAGLWWFSGRDLAQFVTVDMFQIAYGVLIAAAMIASGLLVGRAFPKFAEKMMRDQAYSLAFLKNKLGFGPIIVLSLCAGIWEEALFRGGLLTFAGDYMPFWLALIATSALFAAIHFAKLRVAVFIFAIGCVFGLLYIALESLLAVMIGHALYDVWALWFVQKEMHRLGVFDELETAAQPVEETAELG